VVGCYFSFRYFIRIQLLGDFKVEPETDVAQQRMWDMKAVAAHELGFIFGLLTITTGMVFSLTQWNALWSWDPRQTSFLIGLLIYGAFFGLRGAFSDPDKRAANSAAYVMAAMLPIVFLIYVFPRLHPEDSLHPTNSIMSGNIRGQYAYVVLATITLTSIVSVWLYRMRVQVGILELDKFNGKLEDSRGDSASAPVVRPVRLSNEG
jgi:heme exporter protein C